DLSLAAVVILIRRFVRNDVLRSQLFRDLFERPLEFQHVAREESLATGLFTQLREELITLVLHRPGLDARYASEESCLGGDAEDGRLGSLRDVNRILEVRPAKSIFAVSDQNNHPPTRRASQLFIRKLPY